MNYKMELKRGGRVEQQQGGVLPDPVWDMGLAAQGVPKASVEARISHWGDHVSISFTVTLECPQSEGYLQLAAEHAARTATSFVNEMASRFDTAMPLLPTGG